MRRMRVPAAALAAAMASGIIGAWRTAPHAAQSAPRTESASRWYADGQATLDEALKMSPPGLRAKNVILFIGDGMGVSTVTASRILEGQMQGGPGEDHALSFETLPYLALSKTYSANQQVSDSAPTMTAMVTGVKTNDGILGLDQGAVHDSIASASGHELPTLLELAEDAGLSTGIVSTARVTHATPAATYAHTVDRNWEDDASTPEAARRVGYPDIARQFVEFRHGNGIDVALGGGRMQFSPLGALDPEYPRQHGARLDGRDLAGEWVRQRPRSQYVWNAAQLAAVDPARTDRLLGLFEPSHMQYEHDRARDGAGEPSLTEMTATALDILSRNPRGYFLMVESGRIDHAHHGGNAFRALTDTIELSNAVRLAMRRTRQADTLIVVTADHSHSLTLSGHTTRGNPILGLVRDNATDGRPGSHPSLDLLGAPYTTLGYRDGPGWTGVSPAQPEGPKAFPHEPTSIQMPRSRPDLTRHATTDPNYMQEVSVPLGSESHAGEDVAIYAGGPASQLFHGVREQHYIFHVMAHALRLAR